VTKPVPGSQGEHGVIGSARRIPLKDIANVGSSSLKKTAKSSATRSSLKAGKYTVRNGTFINRARCSLRASFRRNVESIKPRHIAFQGQKR